MWDLSSQTRDQIHVPCIGRQTPNHWTSKEMASSIFKVEPAAFAAGPDVRTDRKIRVKNVFRDSFLSSWDIVLTFIERGRAVGEGRAGCQFRLRGV